MHGLVVASALPELEAVDLVVRLPVCNHCAIPWSRINCAASRPRILLERLNEVELVSPESWSITV